MNTKKKILFPYINMSTFIEKDLHILKRRYTVWPVRYQNVKNVVDNFQMIHKVDAIFCWFGSIRFLPLILLGKILKKKIIVVSGGYDVANVPELKYGNMCPKYKWGLPRILGIILFRMADRILCVSESNYHQTLVDAKVPPNKTVIIKHGFSDIPETLRKRLHKNSKDMMAITVANIDSCTIHIKGLLAVARLSKYLPDTPFLFIGKYEPEAIKILRKESSEKAEFLGFLEHSKLHEFFLRAKIYLQLSLHESFGCSMAESMLFNCIPVVSDKYALPEVVGNAGFCVNPEDLKGISVVVDKILKGNIYPLENPRERILKEFPIEKRAEKLLSVMKDILKK